ncbi:unnamed protein product, partial [Musa textilis]
GLFVERSRERDGDRPTRGRFHRLKWSFHEFDLFQETRKKNVDCPCSILGSIFLLSQLGCDHQIPRGAPQIRHRQDPAPRRLLEGARAGEAAHRFFSILRQP